MDRYKEGAILGTSLVMDLRRRRFKGYCFIRSANDDFDSCEQYLKAGANGNLSKA